MLSNIVEALSRDLLKGGLADRSKYSDFDPSQLRLGAKAEKEHTKSTTVAREIASDHLKEFPKYYTYLKRFEKTLSKLRKLKK